MLYMDSQHGLMSSTSQRQFKDQMVTMRDGDPVYQRRGLGVGEGKWEEKSELRVPVPDHHQATSSRAPTTNRNPRCRRATLSQLEDSQP